MQRGHEKGGLKGDRDMIARLTVEDSLQTVAWGCLTVSYSQGGSAEGSQIIAAQGLLTV